MNKDLDRLFDQARQSLKSDMPLKEVQQLIHAQASPSLWTNQKFWIMNTFIGIISISSFLLWNSYNPTLPNKPITNNKNNATPTLLNQSLITNSQFTTLQTTELETFPMPIVNEDPILPVNPIEPIITKAFSGTNPTLDLLDSLGPKKNFTEYKLEIKKENSEREIKQLKNELASYGIHMEIKELSYNDENKIKRFKGKFKTDSLFCGSTMSDYEFDISGSFQKMEFVFRVADNNNLKYLKIQSDDFEETIECYDDEVIANTQEAERMRKKMRTEMDRARAEMDRARAEMDRTKREMEKLKEKEVQNIWKQKYPYTFNESNTFYYDDENPFNWKDFNKNLQEALKDLENIDHKAITKEVQKALKKYNKNIFDKEFEVEMKELEKEMNDLHYNIEIEVQEKIKAAKERQAKRERDNNIFFEEEASAEALEKEAKALEKEAKELREKAKKKAKEEKKKKK